MCSKKDREKVGPNYMAFTEIQLDEMPSRTTYISDVLPTAPVADDALLSREFQYTTRGHCNYFSQFRNPQNTYNMTVSGIGF